MTTPSLTRKIPSVPDCGGMKGALLLAVPAELVDTEEEIAVSELAVLATLLLVVAAELF